MTQTLGGNVTVSTDRGLFRIDRENAGAIEGFALPEASPAPATQAGPFEEKDVWAALKTCFDPEIPVNIVDLGLVYDLAVEALPSGGRSVAVKMTLTAPGCPVAGSIVADVDRRVRAVEGISGATVELVWDPPWRPEMMSKLARVMLGM